MAIYIGNIVGKNRRKRGEKEHPRGLPRDVQYYWRMVRDCNSHELRSRAPFTARTVCACSEPGNFVAVSNPMPITIKIKHPHWGV